MSDAGCLFEIQGTGSYVDTLWIAALAVGLGFGQIIVLAPLIKPTITITLELSKERLSAMESVQQQPQDQDNNQAPPNAIELVRLLQKENDEKLAKFWKDYTDEFNVFGFNFPAYILIITIACLFVMLGTVFLIYSVDDPRTVWQNEGWKKTINGPTMLIVIVGGSSNLMLGTTKQTIKHVLTYHKSSKVTYAFLWVYWVSVLTVLVFFCVYYPYIVCSLLAGAFSLAIGLAIICTCGACCTVFCAMAALYAVMDACFKCLLCPFKRCMTEEKYEFRKDLAVFCACYVALQYGMMVLVLTVVFVVTGGIDNTHLCVRDNVKSVLALLALQCGIPITIISSLYKVCKCIKANAGTMELKDEYKSMASDEEKQ